VQDALHSIGRVGDVYGQKRARPCVAIRTLDVGGLHGSPRLADGCHQPILRRRITEVYRHVRQRTVRLDVHQWQLQRERTVICSGRHVRSSFSGSCVEYSARPLVLGIHEPLRASAAARPFPGSRRDLLSSLDTVNRVKERCSTASWASDWLETANQLGPLLTHTLEQQRSTMLLFE
jgi:hypothetical protein